MKTILFFSAVIVFVSTEIIIVRKGNDILWKEFKKFFNKTYSPDEDHARKLMWEKAMLSHMLHNTGFYNGTLPFRVGMNHFADVHEYEFKGMSTGLINEINCNNRSLIYKPPNNAKIPHSIDWNKKGYVTEVVNQGSCGACWAFCGVAALEGQLKRMTGKLVKLSEQQLIDCSTITGNKQCEGGQMCRAYEYAAMAGGVSDGSSYPFKEKGGVCKFSKDKIGSKVTGYLEIPYGDEHALMMAVALIGPVAAGLDGYREHFRYYKGGVYDDPGCSNTTLNHALTIVGYGRENGKDYWLVKNSWGSHWGENGFGKMVRNKHNQCGLASRAIFPTLSVDKDGDPILDGPRAL